MTSCILCPGALADPDAHGPAQDSPDWPAAAAAAVRGSSLRRGRILLHDTTEAPLTDWPHDRWLRERFGLPAHAHPDACDALDLLGDSRPEGALVVRPANLHVGLDQLMLMPPHAVCLSQSAAGELRDAANAHFGERGPRLEVLSPGCWLLLPSRPLAVTTRPAGVAVGRSVGDYLPEGPDADVLARWINEVQMVWHGHPVNEEREATGHLPVNWLWVDGPLPEPGASPFASVHADRPSLRALARAAGAREVTPAPRGAAELRELLDDRARLVELAGWRRPVLEGDAAGWRDAWDGFAELLAPALRAAPRAARLQLVLTGERTLVVLQWSAGDRWKWWRAADRGPRPATGR